MIQSLLYLDKADPRLAYLGDLALSSQHESTRFGGPRGKIHSCSSLPYSTYRSRTESGVRGSFNIERIPSAFAPSSSNNNNQTLDFVNTGPAIESLIQSAKVFTWCHSLVQLGMQPADETASYGSACEACARAKCRCTTRGHGERCERYVNDDSLHRRIMYINQ